MLPINIAGEFSTNDITFTKAGTYVFHMKEVGGTELGYDYDTKTIAAVVGVTKSTTANKYDAEVKYYENYGEVSQKEVQPIFNNTYTEKKVTYKVTGTDKPSDFKNTDIPAEMIYAKGAIVTVASPLETTATSKYEVPGKWTFSGWTPESGIVQSDISGGKFTMPENDVVLKGEWIFTSKGKTDPEKKPTPGSDPKDPKPCLVDPPIKKLVQGDPEKAGTFVFKMKAVSNTAGYAVNEMPMPDGSVNGEKHKTVVGGGEYEFGIFEITKAGVYNYILTEVDAEEEGYTYDTTRYTVTYTVTESGGALSAVRVIKDQTGKECETVEFLNIYEGSKSDADNKDNDEDKTVNKVKKVKKVKKEKVQTVKTLDKTGDDFAMIPWMVALVLSALGVIAAPLVRREKKSRS